MFKIFFMFLMSSALPMENQSQDKESLSMGPRPFLTQEKPAIEILPDFDQKGDICMNEDIIYFSTSPAPLTLTD